MIIDTHCHLDDPAYCGDFHELIARQISAGVERIIVPGVNAQSVESVALVCSQYPDFLSPALGLHPEEVKENYEEELDKLHAALCDRDKKWIAIGEIGLDYHFDKTFRTEQITAFRRQILWAVTGNLPVIVHSRDATADCLDILSDAIQQSSVMPGADRLRGVVHCFSGSQEVAKEIIKMGFYLGIGGVITFKNAKLADALTAIPLNRLVLETDGPYMAPVPFRGKRNESRYIQYVAEALANVYHCPLEEIYRQTAQNAMDLFFAGKDHA